jgi:hypothetical protein
MLVWFPPLPIGVLLYLEIQEGKERMARQKYVDEYQATSACTGSAHAGCAQYRFLIPFTRHNLYPKPNPNRYPYPSGENSLAPDKKLQRVVYGGSWFASMETMQAVRGKWGLHFSGVIKTAHKGFPLEMCRWTLIDEDRGKHVVFKTVDVQNVWAIGWSDIHFKTFITTQGWLPRQGITPVIP